VVFIPEEQSVDEPFGSRMMFHVATGTYHLVWFTSKEAIVDESGKVYFPHVYLLSVIKNRASKKSRV